ncbi:unnamed protein product [Leptosia nina]|uniref:TIL domain-containing protein n=1 Tax=Leptosia nina TaxID=320188 RepID=A0AAV1JY91_9NEOP
MTFVQILFVCFALIVTSGAKECGINEVLDDCPVDCPYDYCPKNELQDRIPCPKPKQCPPADCKCGFNYRRENGTCIPTTECPAFPCTGPNEIYDPCPPYCPVQDCSSATPTAECPYFLFIVMRALSRMLIHEETVWHQSQLFFTI